MKRRQVGDKRRFVFGQRRKNEKKSESGQLRATTLNVGRIFCGVMEKIASFTIDHNLLERGLYVSRTDECGKVYVTTFDLRFTRPNRDAVMSTGAVHTVEHIFATYFRNSAIKDRVVYFGPMGCRTGFYLVMFGRLSPEDVFDAVIDACDHLLSFAGEIPGATARECGNYSDQDLPAAKAFVKAYRDDLASNKRFVYPVG